MKNLKKLFFATFILSMTALSGCLHIIEEVTFRNNGSGNYKMTLDMSEMKGMMDMFKGMGDTASDMEGDSTAISGEGDFSPTPDVSIEDPMGGLGEQMSSVAGMIKGIQGITNIVEINDSSSFKFGFSFDFADVAALNRALKVINKDKYDTKVDEVFRFSGKSFERLNVGNLGSEMQKAMMSGEDDDAEGGMEMFKMFLADMSYKQLYHFPDRVVKKNDNKFGEVINNGHTVSITLKPFDEEQMKKKASVATKLKLK